MKQIYLAESFQKGRTREMMKYDPWKAKDLYEWSSMFLEMLII